MPMGGCRGSDRFWAGFVELCERVGVIVGDPSCVIGWK